MLQLEPMPKTKYVKSFSNGQITVPKEFRETLGLGNDFWLRMSLQSDYIVSHPVKQGFDRKAYIEGINSMDSSGFTETDLDGWKNVRGEFDNRIKKYDW